MQKQMIPSPKKRIIKHKQLDMHMKK